MYRKGFAIIAGLLLSSATSLAFAQSASVSSETVNVSATSVTVDWNYTAGGVIEGVGLDLTFDDGLLTPQTTGSNVDGCLSGVDTNLESCQTIAANTIRITLQNLGSTIDTDQSGTITFDIAGSASAGDFSDLTLAVPSTSPAGEAVTLTDGRVEIVSGPQSELTLTPDPMAFGTVDLGVMPVTDTFTVENIGAADATISAVALAGPDGEFTIAADSCTGALAAGATCTVEIQFNATANGAYTNQLDITSDANVNPNPSAAITGSADSVANLSVSPAFGSVNLGTIVVGQSATSNGSISNTGSAAGDFSCALTGDPEISVTPSPLSGTVAAGESADFSIACDVPDSAVEGDSYSAVLECNGDNGFGGVHEISCSATEFEPLPVPTLSNWSLALLTLLMVMIGGLSVRFFRT